MELKLLWIIQLAPLAAFLLIQLLPKSLKKIAPFIGLASALTAAASSIKLFLSHLHSHGFVQQYIHEWLKVSDQKLWPFTDFKNYTLVVGFLLDPLNLLMITMVTVIAFFVQLFSAYYMYEDESRARYFGFINFFAFSMTGLVLSNNLLQTFLFWELVGLTSYLLIGFWYQKQSAATAARKAFVINRLADLGFYLGICGLFILTGTVSFRDLNPIFLNQVLQPHAITIIGILIFMGVMGKSAQFPFHNWLPDAMEGPTPVSALIHSATMVAAGVFLLSRAFGLFSASPTTLLVILCIGSITALLAAAVATVQVDIKKIMAYSTISQLGLMVMAAGAGSNVASMFHLSTHAFFKSLLFLTAGAFIHHCHTNDIWEIAKKGGKHQKIAMFALILGLASLCGMPPFAGFFSKDMILEALKERSLAFFGIGLLVSFLTVYYSCRMLFVILWAKEDKHGHHDKHHEPAFLKYAMALPLISLAVISVIVGLSGSPFNGFLLHWLGSEHHAHFDWTLILITLGLIAGGSFLAYTQFKNPESALAELKAKKVFMQNILEKKFYVDETYEFVVKQIGLRIAMAFHWFDRTIINGLMVNQTSFSVMRLGKIVSKLQNGQLQDYLSMALFASAAVVFYLIK